MLTGYAYVLIDDALMVNCIATKEFTEGVEIMKLTRLMEDGDRSGWQGQPTVRYLPTIFSLPTEVIFAGCEHNEQWYPAGSTHVFYDRSQGMVRDV
jgi:hypothetical protein